MTTERTPFLLPDEVEKIRPVTDRARKRAEAAGLFPQRVKLALHKPGWRRSEIEAWQADPRGWAAKAKKKVA
jgi:predicted DNA-binding transcriptional regulator AlpA